MKTICIAGTIGKDAVIRRTQAGEPILGFSVAVDDGYGENKQTMWFDVALWGKRGQALEPHLKKGTKVTVSGDFSTRLHENKTYFTCRANDITIQGGGDRPAKQERRQEPNRDSYGNLHEDLNDDLPF